MRFYNQFFVSKLRTQFFQLIVNYDIVRDAKEVKFVEVGKSSTGLVKNATLKKINFDYDVTKLLMTLSRVMISHAMLDARRFICFGVMGTHMHTPTEEIALYSTDYRPLLHK